MLEGGLVMVEKTRIDTWSSVLREYVKELYGSRGEL
jgi:hypothetical protein